jgi:hypothetical protein
MSQPQDGHKVRDLTPQEVAEGLQAGRVVLVDVREPNDFPAPSWFRFRLSTPPRSPRRRAAKSYLPVVRGGAP